MAWQTLRQNKRDATNRVIVLRNRTICLPIETISKASDLKIFSLTLYVDSTHPMMKFPTELSRHCWFESSLNFYLKSLLDSTSRMSVFARCLSNPRLSLFPKIAKPFTQGWPGRVPQSHKVISPKYSQSSSQESNQTAARPSQPPAPSTRPPFARRRSALCQT